MQKITIKIMTYEKMTSISSSTSVCTWNWLKDLEMKDECIDSVIVAIDPNERRLHYLECSQDDKWLVSPIYKASRILLMRVR